MLEHTTTPCIITFAYEQYRESVIRFIDYRIHDQMEAEDMTQDVFMRLLEYKQMLRPESVKSFVYTIARNLVTDYLRHFYKRQEIEQFIIEDEKEQSYDLEQHLIVRDLENQELKRLSLFPAQRKAVYAMSRYRELTVEEISLELSLSRRTVENHLRLGRKEMRESLRACI